MKSSGLILTRLMRAFCALSVALTLVTVPAIPASAGDVGDVVDLVLLPPSQTVNEGDTFDITIQAQCNGQDVTGISAFLNFEPAYLEVQSVTGGSTLDTGLLNIYDNQAGTVDYSAGTLTRPWPNSTFTVATINFKWKASTGGGVAPIIFSTSGIRITDADYGGTSKLRSATGAIVSIEDACFIATAAYGMDAAEEIDILREFRDEILLSNNLGIAFVSLYYELSPPIADFIAKDHVLMEVVREDFIAPLVTILKWTRHLWSNEK